MQPGLIAYYQKLRKDFHRIHHDLLHQCGPDTVHQFRLNLKQQAGFYRLLGVLNKDFDPDTAFMHFAGLYKLAGKVRDIQVEKEVVARDEKHLYMDRAFSAWLGEKESDTREQLRGQSAASSMAPIHRLEARVISMLRRMPPETLTKRLPRYFDQHLKTLRKRLKKKGGIGLHDLRKEVKELYFNLRLLDQVVGKGTIPLLTLERLNAWQKLLGRWHDYDFILQRIDKNREPCPKAVLKQYKTRLAYFQKEIGKRIPMLDRLLARLGKDLDKLWPELDQLGTPRRKPRLHRSQMQKNINESYL